MSWGRVAFLPGRVADHAGEVADQKNRDVAQLLKSAELANYDCVAQMNIGSGRIGPKLHAQRLAGFGRLLELRTQFGLANDLGGPFAEISELFVDVHRGTHQIDRVAQLSKGALSSFSKRVSQMITETIETNPLSNCRLAFIGCGVMAEAIIAGLLRKKLVAPEQIVGSHPRVARREEMHVKYGVEMFEQNREAVWQTYPEGPDDSSMLVLAVKPQRLHSVLEELKGLSSPGTTRCFDRRGREDRNNRGRTLACLVVRTMPNTPAQIGEGVTAWTASAEVNEKQESQVCAMLEALGKAVRVENERQIDMATALSATGPTYIFLMMEALIDAGVHMGFSRHVAQELVHQMMLGAVLFARESHKHPAELRNMVTSPGGTSAEAIYQMEKGGLRTVLSKAVWAAYQRAESLG